MKTNEKLYPGTRKAGETLLKGFGDKKGVRRATAVKEEGKVQALYKSGGVQPERPGVIISKATEPALEKDLADSRPMQVEFDVQKNETKTPQSREKKIFGVRVTWKKKTRRSPGISKS